MDVKTTFLNGDLEEEIYMSQPKGFVIEGQENKVCKLKKSLYGLKQAPKQWYEKFNNTLVRDGYVVNNSDSCVYSKVLGSDCVIICLYIDDILILCTSIIMVNKTKEFLLSQFEMKDLGEADVILGVRVIRNSDRIFLSQSHYVEKVLKKFNSFGVVPARTPYDSRIDMTKNMGGSVSQIEYAKIIDSVMFLMNCTRPDIAYVVSRLSRYTHNPSSSHWTTLHRLLKYLKGTSDICLHFEKFPTVLEGYCDANWVSGNDEISSTSGYVFTLGGASISWKSAKKTCIARSTMEYEFIALELADQEADWLRNLLTDMPMWEKHGTPVFLHCDSDAVTTRLRWARLRLGPSSTCIIRVTNDG
ncbi:transmembrane signal receptor [Lithospermum erythrorhizon]|uniref:Transmembrane signal receptor n=1 Tax=Lithospermum erythrorhizon TaxID=34254 RepID=A0AAV3P9P5_LITER